ncbi:MAG TPA: CRTAC1 family protein [Bryobacteraceae bacterium]|nr:CRTAC1 family protein [Bryobacteraceae bacterium]
MKFLAAMGALAGLALLLAGAFSTGNASAPVIRFREVAAEAGISFVLENHPTPEKHLIETIPGGIAVLDYDGDGRPDIYFTNGADIPSLSKTSPKYWNRLYRNEGNWKFRDVTQDAGVAGQGYSMGVAAADYDNDGHPDLFVAGVNRNTLYHNLGNGRFEDVTAKAGIKSGEWAVAAGWLDYDRDGWLDLWVVHYAKWSPSFDRYCGDATRGLRIYCHPKYFEGVANTLYRNRGDGTFEDVTDRAGLAGFIGRGMSVAFADYDDDGFPDVFVTNDSMPNFLFHNRGNGTFEEVGLPAGTALRDDGKPISNMGAEFKDYDNDGSPDIFVTALASQTFPVFRNRGNGNFADATYASRMGALSLKHSAWGLGLFDFNNDGWKDLFTANSHVNDHVAAFEAAVYKEANTIFANEHGRFRDVSAGSGLEPVKAHRGAAFADFDGDGRIDAVVSALGESAELWQNVSTGTGHWIIVRLRGTKDNRDGIGARIRIGDQMNEMTTTVGYASSAAWGVHFGVGGLTIVPKIEIRWPHGGLQTLTDVRTDQLLTVRQPN